MKLEMTFARESLLLELEKHPVTSGLYVRVYGKHLIMGREEPFGPEGEMVRDDRVRLTRANASNYSLSVKRHTGRWESTPFQGTMAELVEVVQSIMQHLVAPWG